VAKLTVSLSEDARRRIERRAADLGVTRSAFVEGLVQADAQSELQLLLEEGYRATAAENLEFAQSAAPLAWEAIERAGAAW